VTRGEEACLRLRRAFRGEQERRETKSHTQFRENWHCTALA